MKLDVKEHEAKRELKLPMWSRKEIKSNIEERSLSQGGEEQNTNNQGANKDEATHE